MRLWDACCHELQTVAFWQVYVPLLIFLTDQFHWKAFFLKGLIHFITHLEAFQMDARTNLGDEILGI